MREEEDHAEKTKTGNTTNTKSDIKPQEPKGKKNSRHHFKQG